MAEEAAGDLTRLPAVLNGVEANLIRMQGLIGSQKGKEAANTVLKQIEAVIKMAQGAGKGVVDVAVAIEKQDRAWAK